MDRQTDRQRERQTDRQTDDRQIEGQTDAVDEDNTQKAESCRECPQDPLRVKSI